MIAAAASAASAACPRSVGVLGGSSYVGRSLLPELRVSGCRVVAFSRTPEACADADGIDWRGLPDRNSLPLAPVPADKILAWWVALMPIWALPDHFALLESYGVRRIVVLSSTSQFTKCNSSSRYEKDLARRLAESEVEVQAWADTQGVEWIVLRPTLIYGYGQDRNITEIARFIRRFGFFPLLGSAGGLRQPVHADDVAKACVSALFQSDVAGWAFNISGGEVITYREMVERIFRALQRQSRFVVVPLWGFQLVMISLRLFSKYRHWSIEMIQRMNSDLVFDHEDARHRFGFNPRVFTLSSDDVSP